MPVSLQQKHDVAIGDDLGRPVVELATATRVAKQKLFELRAQTQVRAGKSAIVRKHGSRKGLRITKKKTLVAPPPQQDLLDF
jgi:deoxyribodipyrimidine photo-lyase